MDINVRHLLPVINGFVSIPDGQILYPTKLSVKGVLDNISGSKLVRMGPGGTTEEVSGSYTVHDDVTQRTPRTALYIALPAFDAPGQPGTDYFQQLRTLATQ